MLTKHFTNELGHEHLVDSILSNILQEMLIYGTTPGVASHFVPKSLL